eukprot:TRINITY_DN3176_c0_g1_i4.p1 TRINITY_DN3176_c0_g1~~TRINITY_DN3176_c0_g1_i4.p1  ORF type:complete len:226 (+),score=50.86 TRINITY_DN3176_c0_g1_i4:111-788(+)
MGLLDNPGDQRYYVIAGLGLSAAAVVGVIVWKRETLGAIIQRLPPDDEPSKIRLQPDSRVAHAQEFRLNGSKWAVGHCELSHSDGAVEYFREGDAEDNWIEMLACKFTGGEGTKEFLAKHQNPVEFFITNLRNQISEEKLKIIYRRKNEFLVEFRDDLDDQPTVINLHKTIFNSNGFYSFIYSTKDIIRYQKDKKKWLQIVGNLTVVEHVPIEIIDIRSAEQPNM